MIRRHRLRAVKAVVRNGEHPRHMSRGHLSYAPAVTLSPYGTSWHLMALPDRTKTSGSVCRSVVAISSPFNRIQAICWRDRIAVVVGHCSRISIWSAQPPKLGVARSNRARVTIKFKLSIEPALLVEERKHADPDKGHESQNHVIRVSHAQFRHILEVHPVNARDESQRQENS